MEIPEVIATQSRGFRLDRIEHNTAPVQKVDHHDHGSKTLAIVALVAACVALGMVVMYVILQAQIIDAKIAAGAAKSDATSQVARVDARVAVDEIERMRTALAARGIVIPKPEH